MSKKKDAPELSEGDLNVKNYEAGHSFAAGSDGTRLAWEQSSAGKAFLAQEKDRQAAEVEALKAYEEQMAELEADTVPVSADFVEVSAE